MKTKEKEPWNPFVNSSDEEDDSDGEFDAPTFYPSQDDLNPFADNPFDDEDPFSVLFKVIS